MVYIFNYSWRILMNTTSKAILSIALLVPAFSGAFTFPFQRQACELIARIPTPASLQKRGMNLVGNAQIFAHRKFDSVVNSEIVGKAAFGLAALQGNIAPYMTKKVGAIAAAAVLVPTAGYIAYKAFKPARTK